MESDTKIPPAPEQLKVLQADGKFRNLRRPERPDPFAATDEELMYQGMFPGGFRVGKLAPEGIDHRTVPVALSADRYSRAFEGLIYSFDS